MPGFSMKSLMLATALALSPALHASDTPSGSGASLAPTPVTPGRPHGQHDPHGQLSPETLVEIALQHKMEGRPHEAINTLSQAMLKHDNNAQLYAVRGSIYLEQGRVAQALRDLEAAIKLNPDDADALTNRAQAYRGFGRNQEALADLNRALELNPDLIPARFNRGAMLYGEGKLGLALADFDHCVAVDPHAPTPYFNRAAVYDAMHNRKEAVADIERFMELTDNENWKRSAQEILKAWADKDKAAAEAKQ